MSKIGIIIILSILIVILLTYLYFIKKEIRNVTKQLDEYNKEIIRKKIDISLFDKDIEKLTKTINDHIDVHIKSIIKQKDAEDELKRAIANISHDIRTPLTSVLGYMQMSRRDDITYEKRIECINIAESRAKSLKSILEKLFSFSIVQSPEYKMEIEYVNLNNILYEVISSYYDEFKKNNIELNIDIEEDNVVVLGNKIETIRILENLITNLIKYSKGNENIKLKIQKDKGVLIISNKVENLKEEDIKLLFDRFYKQDISRNSCKSSGLGLSIAKTLIEKMEGDINVKLIEDHIYLMCRWRIAYIK